MEVVADFFSKLIGADRIVNLVAAFLLAGLYFAYLYIYRHKQFKTPESLEAKRIDSISYDKVLAKIDTETANELARKKADEDAKKSTGSIITIRQGLYGVAIFFLIMVLSEIVFRIYI